MNDLKDYNAAIREYKSVVKLFPTSAQAQDSQYMVSYIYGSVLENKKVINSEKITKERYLIFYVSLKLKLQFFEIAFIFALVMNIGSYWFSDKIILKLLPNEKYLSECKFQ